MEKGPMYLGLGFLEGCLDCKNFIGRKNLSPTLNSFCRALFLSAYFLYSSLAWASTLHTTARCSAGCPSTQLGRCGKRLIGGAWEWA